MIFDEGEFIMIEISFAKTLLSYSWGQIFDAQRSTADMRNVGRRSHFPLAILIQIVKYSNI